MFSFKKDAPKAILLNATLPNSGRRLSFEQQSMPSDGRCGFAVFAENLEDETIARVRADVADTLLRLKSHPADRKMLADEIAEAYVHERFGQLEEPQIMGNSSGPVATPHAMMTELTEFYANTQRNELLVQQAFITHCKTEAVFADYIENLRANYWLGQRSMQLYAREKGIELYIWRKNEGSNELFLAVHQAVATPNRVLHVVHTAGSSHFDRLEPMPEPAMQFQETERRPIVPIVLKMMAAPPKSAASADNDNWF